MKISTFLATGLGVFLFAGAASAATFNYTAELSGAEAETTTTAKGTADITLDDVAKTVDVSIQYSGFTSPANKAQFRTGDCTEIGTLIRSFTVENVAAGEGISGNEPGKPFEVTDEQIQAIKDGNSFMVMYSEGAFSEIPEIRGQVHEGTTNKCAVPDAGAGTPDSGTTTPTVDAGTTTPTTDDDVVTTDDGGCNTSGTGSNGTNGLVALGLGLAVYGLARKRMKKA